MTNDSEETSKTTNHQFRKPYLFNQKKAKDKKRQATEPKSSIWRTLIGILMIILLTVFMTFLGTNLYLTGRLPWDGILNDRSVLSSRDIRRLNNTYRVINDQYFEDINGKDLVSGAINGMTESIQDPYSQFLQDSARDNLDQTIDGSFEGIGAEVMQDGDKIKVVSPIKDSPAEKAGLKANDYILKVDGKSLEGFTVQEAVDKIRGKAGSTVKLTIERAGNVQDLTVKRGEVHIETVHSELLDNSSIGYIHITNFSEPTYKEVVTAIKDLRKEGANRFILDVRGNPGGLLPSVLQIANIFLNDGDTIVKVQEKGEDPEVIKASYEDYGNFRVDEPVSLLVDEGSASASEILAGALKESANIPVIGTQTFGKGTVQSVLPVDKESELKLTIARWLTPDGHWINEKGVQPTEKVELPDYAHLSLIDTTKIYREGDQSESIENIAHILNALDYLDDEFVTDQFSSQMTQAVKEFQAESNLDSNGEVDAETGTELVRQVQVKIKNNDTQLDRAKKLMEKE